MTRYIGSSIKLCAAVAALQKIKQIRQSLGVDMSLWTPLSFHPLTPEEKCEAEDPSNLNGHKITIAHEIRKLFLVSDNEAYNRLYGFIGQRCLNQAMWDAGLESVQLTHRLSKPMTEIENRLCAAVEVDAESGAFTLAPKRSTLQIDKAKHLNGIAIGTAHLIGDKQLVLYNAVQLLCLPIRLWVIT
ncbi:hypothetical protein CBR_g49680 [Chara braunii]|uniref:Beta-lactamase class A catalytic domain-containing protein n=1 Tax=Chara braunii TaxID=69332 RepID=A0A388M5K0_CHABU|nr:hypothetical protein CBR_g49680 [Chara braunii]|eukprot:GBG89831.1 hypothetical protein CBR_g49680 [Chara braunii]